MDTAAHDPDNAGFILEIKQLTTSQQQQLLKTLRRDCSLISNALDSEKEDEEDPDKPLIEDLASAVAQYRARIAALEQLLA